VGGVSKLPSGFAGVTAFTLTYTCRGELAAPGAVTVTVPLAPATVLTVKLPAPVPPPGATVIFDWLDETVQATPLPAAKPTTTDCALVTSDPDVPKFSTVRFKVNVPGTAEAGCVIATPWPATVKAPLRLSTPALGLTVQGAVLLEIDIDAQLTLEEPVVGRQSPGVGVIVILPEAPLEAALILVLLSPYEHAPPNCEMPAVFPPIVKFPARARELGLALTDQEAIVPTTDTEAQLTPELAAAGEQSTGLAVTVMLPAPPAEPTLKIAGFRL
jgi:hypothetical protein